MAITNAQQYQTIVNKPEGKRTWIMQGGVKDAWKYYVEGFWCLYGNGNGGKDGGSTMHRENYRC